MKFERHSNKKKCCELEFLGTKWRLFSRQNRGIHLNLEKSVEAREIAPPRNAPDYAKNGLITGKVTMPFFARS